MKDRLRVIVSGMVAGVPHHGGATWAVLQYLLGLRELGHEVVLVEPVARLDRESIAYCSDAMARFGLDGQWALLETGTRDTAGIEYGALRKLAHDAELLLNVSGQLTDANLTEHIPVRAYLDLDPAFVQLWHEQGVDMRFDGHTHFFTVGLALGDPWMPTLPPVVLREWPVDATVTTPELFTTVANWRSYGPVVHDGVRYGQKVHSVRSIIGLPGRTGARFALALAIHPDEDDDLRALQEHGWELLDPREVAGTPDAYRAFVQGSAAELGVAKEGYAVSRCGWFSDRSACYLASGRPVVAQDTGFGAHLPTGTGLLTFSDEDGAAAAVDAVLGDYDTHRRAARAVAEEHLDSAKVLTSILDRVAT